MLPIVATRIEKARYSSRQWVNARQVWPFMSIAKQARQRKVAKHCRATVNCRNYVIDFKLEIVEVLRSMTVFTTPLCALPHQLSQRIGFRHRLSTCAPSRLEDPSCPGLQDRKQGAHAQIVVEQSLFLGCQRSRAISSRQGTNLTVLRLGNRQGKNPRRGFTRHGAVGVNNQLPDCCFTGCRF